MHGFFVHRESALEGRHKGGEGGATPSIQALTTSVAELTSEHHRRKRWGLLKPYDPVFLG